jgi:hypothetical protein
MAQNTSPRKAVAEAVRVALAALPEGMTARPEIANPYGCTIELADGKRFRIVVKELD